METLYTLNPRALWSEFQKQSFAFWMMCLYLVLQYFDPLRIYHSLSSLPLDKIAIGLVILTLPMDPKRRWARDSTNIWMVFFWLLTVVSSVLAIYPSISWSHWFDFFNMVTPGVMKNEGSLGLLEIGTGLIFMSVFIWVVLNSLTKMPLFGKNHPMLEESLHHHI